MINHHPNNNTNTVQNAAACLMTGVGQCKHITSAALAASPQTSGFQNIHPCLSFVGCYCSCVASWRMYAGYRRWPPSSVVCWSNMPGQEVTQPVWWPLFCHHRANAVEQSTWTASATGHHL